jgi:hypothetical protein
MSLSGGSGVSGAGDLDAAEFSPRIDRLTRDSLVAVRGVWSAQVSGRVLPSEAADCRLRPFSSDSATSPSFAVGGAVVVGRLIVRLVTLRRSVMRRCAPGFVGRRGVRGAGMNITCGAREICPVPRKAWGFEIN